MGLSSSRFPLLLWLCLEVQVNLLFPQAGRLGQDVWIQPQPSQAGGDPEADEQDGAAAEQAAFQHPPAHHGCEQRSLAWDGLGMPDLGGKGWAWLCPSSSLVQ